MRVTVSVADARAWAAYTRALMAEIAQAKAAGRLSPTLGAPPVIEADLRIVLEEIDALPNARVADLDLSRMSDLAGWVYYARAVWGWAAQLRADGLLTVEQPAAAGHFEAALEAHVLEGA